MNNKEYVLGIWAMNHEEEGLLNMICWFRMLDIKGMVLGVRLLLGGKEGLVFVRLFASFD